MRSGELAPALVAAGGGGALLGAIAVHEHRRDRAMRASRMTYSAVFPVGAEPDAALASLESLSGLDYAFELVAEVVADDTGIHHLLHLPEHVATSVIDQLSAGMPGLRLDPVEARATGSVTNSLRFLVPARALLRNEDAVQGSRSLLSGLAALREGERVSLRWALRPSSAPAEPPVRTTSLRAKAEQRAWATRIARPGFASAGLLLVRANNKTRAAELSRHVTNVLRSRRGVGRGLLIRRGSVRSAGVMPVTGRTRGWLSTGEILPLLGWPLGKEPVQGVEVGAARRLPVPRELPRDGRVLFIGRDPYGERPVVLSPEAARHHVAVVGPSGTGKSTLLTRSILQDMEAGYGGVVIDPKADLVADVLERVPEAHAERVVVLDPAGPGPTPGLDLLGVGDPDLRSDVVLGALGAIFKDSWGVRTDTYLRLGLRTLSELPQPVLTDWLRLFTDARFRRQAVSGLDDPLLIGAWQSYEAMTAAEQNQHVAAPMSKVISLLSRPTVRGVLAQRDPRLDISRLLAERKWLLVSLSPGTLGEPASKLLGAILTYAVWTAIEERAALAKEKRRPVFLYMDELQSLAHLPFGIEYLFERARGLGAGVTVALQTTTRLPESIRQSMLGNVGTLVAFRLGYEEANRLARELPGLGAQDLQALRQFEVAARIGTGIGSGIATVTGHTEAPPEPTGQASRVRRLSSERYGQDVAAIDAELRAHQDADELADDDALGRARRRP